MAFSWTNCSMKLVEFLAISNTKDRSFTLCNGQYTQCSINSYTTMNMFSIWKRPFINDPLQIYTHIFIYRIALNFCRSSTICKNISTKNFDAQYTHFLAGASMNNIPGLSYWIYKELSSKRNLQSRNCFDDSGKLEWTTECWYVLDKSGLSATPKYYMCSVRVQQIIHQNFQNSLLVKI